MTETFRNRVTLEKKDGTAYVTLSRADKYNGLDFDMMEGLIDAAKAVKKDRNLRVVIMQGDGKAFCAGLDFATVMTQPLKVLKGFTKYGIKKTNLFQQVCWCWRELPVPVITVLHGYCYGGGMQIALAADFRFATPDCEMSIMEIKWGLIPDMTGTVTLRELVPMDVAKELTMTGRLFNGEEAKRLNLVTRVAENPLQEAEKLADAIKSRSPDAISAGKSLFQQTWNASEAQAFDIESKLQFKLMRGKNYRRALTAGKKKQAPEFGPRERDY
ncbi:crotonase/enoyl-CoA hydratase family protein [Alcanivorax sp. S6407]|uniref:crotonase/enoyl-CoA hydratase family protein n=1 Tax=Alcanivorax sp. S6407 TaxID=2926424 RepID=UPI001FF3A5F1|nr:crotonase/enoyl-CoA hydratase family protein [Alcanivorax sp. S6407]MCK0154965.1 crotonase/enoyl-CoA hydratase family protein [Alcanivorax sp. S6407]